MRPTLIHPMSFRFQTAFPLALCLFHCCTFFLTSAALAELPNAAPDFQTQIRPILSNRCFACHGPDEATVESGLRLDSQTASRTPADSGKIAVVPGDPSKSELMIRVLSQDDDIRMPPPHFGEKLSEKETALLQAWIQAGAPYANHWAYDPPRKPILPDPVTTNDPNNQPFALWNQHPVDRFLARKLHEKGWAPAPAASPRMLLRRVSLDITGLPPSQELLDEYLANPTPEAFERAVDRLLASPAYGEHWGRRWLDLARYADSAGYADDPPRTIWAYRDWVIRAYNANMPFDQFTIEQLAGDLLPNPTPDQLVATAFHRNTLTNNEGGTNDEEFRNVAVVDRVNTTMAVWMGVTMACAQCHSHKYDPISQKEYFQVFAVLNQTEDADRGDESPILQWFSYEQRARKQQLESKRETLESQLDSPAPELADAQSKWESLLRTNTPWTLTSPLSLQPPVLQTKSGDAITASPDGLISLEGKANNDSLTIEVPLPENFSPQSVTGLQIESVPDPALPGQGASYGDGNFVLTNLTASFHQNPRQRPVARYIRVELPGKDKILSLAEVQAWSGAENVALKGKATQSSEILGGAPSRAIDGNTSGKWEENSVTHTNTSENPWWELDLGQPVPLDRIALFNRTDNGLMNRSTGALVKLLDEARKEIFNNNIGKGEAEHNVPLEQQVIWQPSFAASDFAQSGFPPEYAIDADPKTGWAVGGAIDQPHRLSIAGSTSGTPNPNDASTNSNAPWVLRLNIAFDSQYPKLVLARFRIAVTNTNELKDQLRVPTKFRTIAADPARTPKDSEELHRYFVREIAAARQPLRDELRGIQSELAAMKPETTVPILRELPENKRRETKIQLRGNYKVTGETVTPGVPQAFGQGDSQVTDRLSLAKWLVSKNNPLTARVQVNRTWEYLFGVGIVRTSEEFGSQGDLPTHPELLDYLAVDFMENGWDQKQLIRTLVLSQAYQQSSSVTPERYEADPENVFVSRGPRFRVSAEQVRDMALWSAGLLTEKYFGPPTRPPQPNMGLSAAFGSRTDWETSQGPDRYRRAVYTQWRRSNPYPSMATFDAPNREVCVLKRDRTNTPLQALVTMNDPAFMEAAQGLARRVLIQEAAASQSDSEKLAAMFQWVLSRTPEERERATLGKLIESTREKFAKESEQAMKLATDPIGPLPAGADAAELATWTLVANILLNLDEFLMTP